MSLAAGSKLGPDEILAPIGAGGMGEVYGTKATKLKREVALKVLLDSFASDPAATAWVVCSRQSTASSRGPTARPELQPQSRAAKS